MKLKGRYASMLLLFCLTALAAQTSWQYRFSAAGNYPGSTYTVPLGVGAEHIVGYYVTPTIHNAYIQTGTTFMNVSAAPNSTAYLSGINNHGTAVGGYCPGSCNNEAGAYGFTYDFKTGKIQTISFPLAGASTAAYGINNLGTIVGGYCLNSKACPSGSLNPADHGFIDTGGVFATLDYPGAELTTAIAINNAGSVVGEYDINLTGPHSFLYQNGAFTNIDFPGASYTVASGVNNLGVVAGFFVSNTGAHGFTYYQGTFTQIDRPNSPNGSGVTGINDREDLVGVWYPSTGFGQTFKAVPTTGPQQP